ncbi:MAG: ribosome silencing factor, partial [Gammaproteobacteria bacterium]
SEDLRDVALAALDEIKAIDVRVLDVRSLTDITDFMIIASGRSNRQVRALADEVVAEATRRGVRPLGVEGFDQGTWVLVDLGDVVVHVMQPATRDFYQLERLWDDTAVGSGRERDPERDGRRDRASLAGPPGARG